MAGRYVILEFDDRDAANAFVQMENLQEQLDFRPLAMYIKPKAYCKCPTRPIKGITKTGRAHNENWRKHPKYGLYICVECKKPSRHHEKGILSRLQYVFGFDLLGAKK